MSTVGVVGSGNVIGATRVRRTLAPHLPAWRRRSRASSNRDSGDTADDKADDEPSRPSDHKAAGQYPDERAYGARRLLHLARRHALDYGGGLIDALPRVP